MTATVVRRLAGVRTRQPYKAGQNEGLVDVEREVDGLLPPELIDALVTHHFEPSFFRFSVIGMVFERVLPASVALMLSRALAVLPDSLTEPERLALSVKVGALRPTGKQEFS